jgi:hypothetical protein
MAKPSAKSRFEANWEALWERHEDQTTQSSASSEEEASSKSAKLLATITGRYCC